MNSRLAVYTMAIGWTYPLPDIIDCDDVDYICFSDQDLPEVSGWRVVPASLILPDDPFRSSRDYKIRPHIWLADYDRSLYVDSTVLLKKNPLELWEHLIGSKEAIFGGVLHSFRESISAEFVAVQKLGFDTEATLREQQKAYRLYMPDLLSTKPVWGGMLARKHNDPDCRNAMETWFANVLRYSRRDQLSLPLALNLLSDDQKNLVDFDLYGSPFHKWPLKAREKPHYQKITFAIDHEDVMETSKQDTQPPRDSRHSIFGYDEESELFFSKDKKTGKTVFVSHKKRLALYKKGFEHRQQWLLQDYRIPFDFLSEGDTVIDVGANAGELGIWVNQLGGRYIGFEPDPAAYKALGKNVSGLLYDVALSDENGTAEFYLDTSNADSSLFEPNSAAEKISVEQNRLDDLLAREDISGNIKLMKVEAEGFEPEVLAGALETLKRVECVAVDAGPERGNENTIPAVLNLLFESGFKIVSCYMRRGTFFLAK